MNETLHKCGHPKCTNYIELKYEYCYEHKNDRLTNGTLLNQNHNSEEILKEFPNASDMTKSVYKIRRRTYRNTVFYYLGSKRLDDTYIRDDLLKIFSKPSLYQAKKYVGKITKGAGTYGIFIRNRRSKLGIGECLYIGQSLNVKNRISQHMDNINIASLYITKGINKKDVPRMYYGMAAIGIENLKFVRLMSIDSRYWDSLNRHDKEELLTITEQYMMDCWEPRYNVVKARPTDFSNIINEDGKFKLRS